MFAEKKLIKNCNFPWLMANVIDTNTGAPLAGAKETLMIERDGVKIGFVGLVESGWLETLTNLPSTTKYLGMSHNSLFAYLCFSFFAMDLQTSSKLARNTSTTSNKPVREEKKEKKKKSEGRS